MEIMVTLWLKKYELFEITNWLHNNEIRFNHKNNNWWYWHNDLKIEHQFYFIEHADEILFKLIWQ